MTEKGFLDEMYLLWIMINQTREAIFRAREKQIGTFRYQKQGAALIIIWARDGQATPTLLARYLFLERNTASELITRMEKNGLVTKKRDERLKNMVRISLTTEGKKVCKRLMGPDTISEILSALPENDRIKLMGYMRSLLSEACKRLGTEVILP